MWQRQLHQDRCAIHKVLLQIHCAASLNGNCAASRTIKLCNPCFWGITPSIVKQCYT